MKTIFSIFSFIFLVILLSGCAATTSSTVLQNKNLGVKGILAEGLKINKSDNEIVVLIKKGIKLIQQGNYASASNEFKKGLRLDPTNANLHFLNALTYHMRSLSGDKSMLSLAEAGYLTALRFDKTNYWAAYLLGHIYFDQQRYLDAQNQFSYGLLYAPKNPQLLKALAIASYYAKDVSTSRWAAKKAAQLNPKNSSTLRALMFSQAASGKFSDAKNTLKKYSLVLKEDSKFNKTLAFQSANQRLRDWKNFYKIAQNDNVFGSSSQFQSDFIDSGNQNYTEPSLSDSTTNSDNTGLAKNRLNFKIKKNKIKKLDLPKMTLVDVVILRTQEIRSQTKGINVLQWMQGTLTGTGIEYNSNSASGTRKLSFDPQFELSGMLQYSLNIFNDGVNNAEVLARPSLLAIDGQESQFYSGEVLHVQLSSSNADGSMVDIPIGIKLDVTPKFYSDDIVQITVHAERSFLETASDLVGYSSFSQTAKTSVDSVAILKLGETLVLSGLSENENNRNENGIPILKDIPGVQYVTSRKEALQSKKSILILLTPRKARYANRNLSPFQIRQELKQKREAQTKFTKNLKDKENIQVTNIDVALEHIATNNPFYNQFRRGDIHLDAWNNENTISGSIIRTLGFLYY